MSGFTNLFYSRSITCSIGSTLSPSGEDWGAGSGSRWYRAISHLSRLIQDWSGKGGMIPGASPYQLLKKKVVSILKRVEFHPNPYFTPRLQSKPAKKNNKSGKSEYASS